MRSLFSPLVLLVSLGLAAGGVVRAPSPAAAATEGARVREGHDGAGAALLPRGRASASPRSLSPRAVLPAARFAVAAPTVFDAALGGAAPIAPPRLERSPRGARGPPLA